MSRKLVRALRGISLLVVGVIVLTGCAQVTRSEDSAATTTITVTDDQDRQVSINGPVERAVVLNTYASEIVRAIGAGDTIVGVERNTKERAPYFGFQDDDIIAEGLDQLNYEAIVEKNPDVVVMPRNAVWQEAAEKLEPFGIPVVVATAWDYDVYDETVSLLGEVFGAQVGAQKLREFYEGIAGLVKERVAGLPTKKVYFETVDPYLTVLPGSGFHSLITAAGGENIFADADGGDAQEELTVDPVEVVSRDPDVIWLEYEPAAAADDASRFAQDREGIKQRPGWSGITAISNGAVYVTNGWATSATGKAVGTLYLAKWLHPEAFQDINPDEYLKRWAEEFQQTDFAGAGGFISVPEELK